MNARLDGPGAGFQNSPVKGSRGEYAGALPPGQIRAACAQYDLPFGERIETGGGTASPKAVLGEPPKRFLLRRRRREFSAPEVVAFDHAVMHRAAGAGLPVFPPLPTQRGEAAVFLGTWAFEVFPYIEGLETFDQDDPSQLIEAADVLGRFHLAMEGFRPSGRKDWRREFHMATNRRALEEELARNAGAPAERALAERILAEARRVEGELTDGRFAALPATVVHGDYTWSNLRYRRGRVAGLFDFDWTYIQPHLEDVARAIIFFAFRRSGPLRADSIRDLVRPWEGDVGRARAFLAAYERHHRLCDEEHRLLPWYVRECWLGCRIRAMRKVPEEQKLKILTSGMEPILDWWGELGEL